MIPHSTRGPRSRGLPCGGGAPCPLTDGDRFTSGVGDIDLGDVIDVRRIRVLTGLTGRPTVRTSEDGVAFDWIEVHDPLPSAIRARYVRVTAPDDIYEVSVW